MTSLLRTSRSFRSRRTKGRKTWGFFLFLHRGRRPFRFFFPEGKRAFVSEREPGDEKGVRNRPPDRRMQSRSLRRDDETCTLPFLSTGRALYGTRARTGRKGNSAVRRPTARRSPRDDGRRKIRCDGARKPHDADDAKTVFVLRKSDRGPRTSRSTSSGKGFDPSNERKRHDDADARGGKGKT